MTSDSQGDARASGRGQRRRAVVRAALAGLGGLAAGRLVPGLVPNARSATAIVTPDPIPARIAPGELAVEIVEFATLPPSSTGFPKVHLNQLGHAGDGSGRLFAVDSRGKLYWVDRATGAAKVALDLKKVRGSAFVAPTSQQSMGFRSFAFHPDRGRAGRPGRHKIYTVSTETIASRPAGVPLLSGPYPVLFHDVIAEWSTYVSAPSLVDPKSRREVLRIAQYQRGHNTGPLAFDPNAAVGSAAYGKMFVAIGDGGLNTAHPDFYDSAQAPGRALGKILRIDPLRQANGASYGVPATNPFVGRSGYLPEIYASGLRHPQHLSFDWGISRGGTGVLLTIDIGQAYVEELNLVTAGANFGWPVREGTFVTDRYDQSTLYALPADDARNGFIYPVAQYDHNERNELNLVAITGGFVYRGSAVPALRGYYLMGDIVTGRIYYVAVSSLRQGAQAVLRELNLRRNGRPVTLTGLLGNPRADLRLGQDEAGEIYVLTKRDGKIRRLAPARA